MNVRIRWEVVPARHRKLARRRRLRAAHARLRALAVVGRHRVHLASTSVSPFEEQVENFMVKAATKLTSLGVGEVEMQPLLAEMRAHLHAQRECLQRGEALDLDRPAASGRSRDAVDAGRSRVLSTALAPTPPSSTRPMGRYAEPEARQEAERSGADLRASGASEGHGGRAGADARDEHPNERDRQ